jgi:hypothetical protein
VWPARGRDDGRVQISAVDRAQDITVVLTLSGTLLCICSLHINLEQFAACGDTHPVLLSCCRPQLHGQHSGGRQQPCFTVLYCLRQGVTASPASKPEAVTPVVPAWEISKQQATQLHRALSRLAAQQLMANAVGRDSGSQQLLACLQQPAAAPSASSCRCSCVHDTFYSSLTGASVSYLAFCTHSRC